MAAAILTEANASPLFASSRAWDDGTTPQQGAGAPLTRPPAGPQEVTP